MSKMVKVWIKDALKNGPLTATQIMDSMAHRRSCPSMPQLGNYLAKSREFEKLPKEARQGYMAGGASWVAVWRLRD